MLSGPDSGFVTINFVVSLQNLLAVRLIVSVMLSVVFGLIMQRFIVYLKSLTVEFLLTLRVTNKIPKTAIAISKKEKPVVMVPKA